MANQMAVAPKYADPVVFDPNCVIDTATYDDPIQYPMGMPYVIVNGVMGVEGGRVTGARVGKVLRRMTLC